MKKHDIILVFVIAILVVFTVWQRQTIRDLRFANRDPAIDTVYTEVVHYDTIHPTPITLVNTVHSVDTTHSVDTVYINNPDLLASDFYAYRYYDDVLKDDSTGYVRIKSTVHKNALEDRELFYQSRYQDRVITKTIYESSRELYFMPSLMVSKTSLGVQGSLLYSDRDNRLYGLNAGYYNGSPFVGFGIGFSF